MDIKPSDIEWAVVDRMAFQLRAVQRTEYAQTLSLALLGGIVDWSCQRIRTPENFPESPPPEIKKLRVFLSDKQFEEVFVVDLNCCVQNSLPLPKWISGFKCVDFVKKIPKGTALDLLVALRNALSHSDARTVQPYNTEIGDPRLLLGFDFLLTGWERGISWKTGGLKTAQWVRLNADQMCAIGDTLADQFCGAMSQNLYQRTGEGQSDPNSRNVLGENQVRKVA
ncbi:MAG: hypothetical protein H0T56_03330 [Pseudaminobacter sp.]|nr:hypothetical protein [Pseudaminobacter sp.]